MVEIYSWAPRSRLGDMISNRFRWFRKNFRPRSKTNFGDELGPWIVSRILELNGITPSKSVLRSSSPTFFSVGSVTSLARNGDIIWGSGHLNEIKPALMPGVNSLEIYALRGPLTRDLLVRGIGFGGLPEVYGDPAILVPYLFPEIEPIPCDGRVLVIPHIDDPMPQESSDDFEFISAQMPFREVVARIAGAERVVTSSLHAKILSDSYGIPNVVYQGATTSKFKFDDYALGVGGSVFEMVPSLDQALLQTTGSSLKVTEVQGRLLDSFPYHVWI